MTYQGRSLDDQPLAAYSTGVVPDEAEEPPAEEHKLSQQDVLAQAMGIAPPPAEVGHGSAQDAAPARKGRSIGMPRLPRLPKPQRSRSNATAGDDDGPRMTPAAPVGAAAAFSASTMHAAPSGIAAPPPFTMAAQAGAGSAGAVAAPGAGKLGTLDLGGVPAVLRDPRAALRDPRVLFGGLIAIGAVFLVVSLGLPGGPGAGAGDAGASQPAVVATVAPPSGVAKIEFKGNQAVIYDLSGQTGAGAAVAGRVDATWTDTLGNSIALAGRAASGTRTTSADLVLTLTTLVNDTPVTFVSQTGECTVGMASQPNTVTGSYTCKKLKSDDGLHVIDVSGTYRT